MSVLTCNQCEEKDWSACFEWDEKTSQFICHSCLGMTDEPDQEDDGEALASAGFGTDEDYGYFGEDSHY
tara:strand:+ start:619 stop:825 length:207 start_codon:yes stop_codon:yes gene_type:complete